MAPPLSIEVLDSVQLIKELSLEQLDTDIAKLDEQLHLLRTLRAVRAVMGQPDYEPTTDLDARLKLSEAEERHRVRDLLPQNGRTYPRARPLYGIPDFS